ncbi:hypothetical protein ACOMHN_038333 [Nucella lapillus]
MARCECSTKIIPVVLAWTLILGCTGLYFAFVCRYLSEAYSYAFPVYQGVLALFVILNLSLTTFMDPGIYPKAHEDEQVSDDFRAPLYKNVEIKGVMVRMKWCTTCQFYRPPRCSHCSACNNCIETFDHHCPWVNNCIGRRNYRYFFLMLATLSLHMVSILAQSVVYVLDHKDQLARPGPIIAISIVVVCIVALSTIPVFGLTGFHMMLVSRGRTTNEQVTGKFKGGLNPFHRGCCVNCSFVLCGPRWPKLVSYIPKTRTIHIDSSRVTYVAAEKDVKISVEASTTANGVRHHSPTVNNSAVTFPSPYFDKGSQSLDCQPSPPEQRRLGSYSNLFDGSNPNPASIGASLQSAGHMGGSNHSLRGSDPHPAPSPAPSVNIYQRAASASPKRHHVRRAPMSPGEDLSPRSPTGGVGGSLPTSPTRERFSSRAKLIHPRNPWEGGAGSLGRGGDRSTKPQPVQVASPYAAAPPVSYPAGDSKGMSPMSPSVSREGLVYSPVTPSPSTVVKDRARTYYPARSRSRENLSRSRDNMVASRSREYLDRSREGLSNVEELQGRSRETSVSSYHSAANSISLPPPAGNHTGYVQGAASQSPQLGDLPDVQIHPPSFVRALQMTEAAEVREREHTQSNRLRRNRKESGKSVYDSVATHEASV